MFKKIIGRIQRIITTTFKIYILRDKRSIALKQWKEANGDHSLRLEYPLDSKSIVFDIGAYKGDWSGRIIERYDPVMYLFEPVLQFHKNIASQVKSGSNVRLYDFGLLDKTCVKTIYLAQDSSSLIIKRSNITQDVKFKNISDFINENNITSIDLMKLNVEGAEYAILEELIKTGHIRSIIDIQVQFHIINKNSIQHRSEIQEKLSRTHDLTYNYYFTWENWRRKS